MTRAHFSPKALVILFAATLIAACTPQEQSAKVVIQLPEPTDAQRAAVASGDVSISNSEWTKEITSHDDVFCYALMIGAPDFRGTRCTNEAGALVADVGSLHGTYPAGGTLEVSVGPGPDRTLYLVGINAPSLASCSNFKLDGSTKNGFSRPHILSKTTVNLVPGDNNVTMVSQVAGATSFERCETPSEEPLPPTLPQGLIAQLSNLPGNPSNEIYLDVTVGGVDITHYRYKLGSETSTECSVAVDYSTPRAVSDNITDGLSGHDDSFPLKLCVVGSDGTDWQSYTEASVFVWKKDTTPPRFPSIAINGGAAYTNNDEVTLTLGATDPLAVQMYVTNAADCASGGDWEAFSSSRAWTLGQINTSATVYVAFRDSVGNTTSCISDSITHDAQDPNNPTGLSLGSIPPSTTTTPVITFTNATDVGPAGINRHEIQIHRIDNSVLQSWQTFTSGNAVTGLSLIDGQQYYAKIRAIDHAGNMSSGVDTTTWTVAGALMATISGEPTGSNTDTVLDVTIGGTNITHYRYKIAETGSINCSSAADYQPGVPGTAVGTKITEDFSSLDDGSITLCVIGSNGSEWQILASASIATWIKDTTGPESTSISINSGASHTKDDVVTLTLSATDARAPLQMYVTNVSGCSSGGTWESYNSTKTWTLGQTNGVASVYVKYRDALANESACISDTIIHDSSVPIINIEPDVDQRTDTHDTAVKFKILVNEPIEGLEFTDFSNVGGASVNNWQLNTISPTEFSLEGTVSGFGAVTPQFNACGATDMAGNCAQMGSTFTVTRHEIRFSQIDAGGSHTCGVTDIVGDVYCWGYNEFGQLGDTNDWDSLVPIKATILDVLQKKFIKVVAGIEHTCALAEYGEAYCWGQNGSGELGAGSVGGVFSEAQLVSGYTFDKLFGGYFQTCGITAAGDAYCWGSNAYGQLGNNTNTNSGEPVLVSNDIQFEMLAIGEQHTCGVSITSELFCWGSNGSGQFGTGGTPTESWVPYSVQNNAQSVSAGGEHTCYLDGSGSIECWGLNSSGQLGDNTTTNSLTPVSLSGSLPLFDLISVGDEHSCALSQASEPYCWGANAVGQLGNNSTVNGKIPALANGAHLFNHITSGVAHTCAISSVGDVYCWGSNINGQLGQGDTTDRLVPAVVTVVVP